MPQKDSEKGKDCSKKLLKFDQYGDGFTFYLPGGKKVLKTYSGCVISLISLFIIIFYTVVQFMKLIEF